MRTMSVDIERLGRGDGRRLRALRLRALRDSPEAFETTFEQSEGHPIDFWEHAIEELATFVATSRGQDVGLVRGSRPDDDPGAGHLISLWVARDLRRRGVGSALVDAVVAWAGDLGLDRVVLEVREGNTAAIALYTRKGWLPTGRVSAPAAPPEHPREIELVFAL